MPSTTNIRETPRTTPIRETVGEAFNIYQATTTMIAIFSGFVFAGLLQLLTGSGVDNHPNPWIIRLLLVSLLLLTFALFLFHATAHRVVRYFSIFYPVSIFNTLGSFVFPMGLFAMFVALAGLLWDKRMKPDACIVLLAATALIIFGYFFRRGHFEGMIEIDPPKKNRT